jgi:hypothetical protein
VLSDSLTSLVAAFARGALVGAETARTSSFDSIMSIEAGGKAISGSAEFGIGGVLSDSVLSTTAFVVNFFFFSASYQSASDPTSWILIIFLVGFKGFWVVVFFCSAVFFCKVEVLIDSYL